MIDGATAADFVAGRASFLVGTPPPEALALDWAEVVDLLRARFGAAVDVALSPEATDPDRLPSELPEAVRSPRAGDADQSWIRRTNMVGVNVRTVGDLAGVVAYALTLPRHADSIHLLPLWEPGAVGSLYGMASWNLNPAFASPAIAATGPHLDTTARQLRAVVNLLHVMGKAVGIDVIPHTDRFSEQALGTPDLFEWMRVEGGRIVDHGPAVTREVEATVMRWYRDAGPAPSDAPDGDPAGAGGELAPVDVFTFDEATRLAALFGSPGDAERRLERRVSLLRAVKQARLEPVPATMGVPFRGIEVDPDPANTVTDPSGLVWSDFVISDPESMSRVFTPLARFHLYESAGPGSWELDFARPRRHVWEYVVDHYRRAQRTGAFDFMRGDMAHVQMRPGGVPSPIGDHYDILGSVKAAIGAECRWFGYFAESFLPARDVFQYGEELDHLDASAADATLGDLQSDPVGSRQFLHRFRRYLDDLATRRTAPAFTVMTADKDDPRFDEFYRRGNELRLFTALFAVDMPSYVGLGFELRDVRWEPVENERYTKLFVFHEAGESNVYPSKARFSDTYLWGSNAGLFGRITELRVVAEGLLDEIGDGPVTWLVPPDATGLRGTAAWLAGSRDDGPLVFVANYDTDAATGPFGLPALDPDAVLVPIYSTVLGRRIAHLEPVVHNGAFHAVADVGPGEGRIYRLVHGPVADRAQVAGGRDPAPPRRA